MNNNEMLALEKLKNFIATNINTQLSNLSLAWLCFFLLKNDANFTALMTWACAFTIVFAVRVIVHFKQKKFLNSYDGEGAIKQLVYFRSSVFMTGFTWSLACFLMYPEQNLEHIYYFTFIVTSVVAGALIIYSLDSFSTLIYPPLIMVPLLYNFSNDLQQGVAPLLFCVLILLLFVMLNAKKIAADRENFIMSKYELMIKERKTAAKEEQYRLLLNHSPIGIVHYGLDMHINYFNKQFANIMGLGNDFDIGNSQVLKNQNSIEFAKTALDGELTKYSGPHKVTDDKIIWINSISSPIRDDKNSIIGGISIIQDVTEHKKAEKKIQHLALHDSLTGLPNKKMFIDNLENIIQTNKPEDLNYTLMLLDIDYFKMLNDTLGHNLGDEFLKEVSFRLKETVKKTDFVGRMGGDEFIVLLDCEDCNEQNIKQYATKMAQKILTNIRKPYNLSGRAYNTSASIGVVASCKNKSCDDLLKQADIAMYQAKKSGRNGIRFFDQSMQYDIIKRVNLEAELKEAIKNKEFILHFQPQVMQDGTICGVEALIRWNHPQKGLIYPQDFITIAEEKDLIDDIGYQVIDMAFKQMSIWKSSPVLGNITMSINVNPKQFERDDFVRKVFALINEYGINTNLIKFEFTEGTLLNCSDKIIDKMKTVRDKGIRFSLDDFGIGYSSLFYLKKLPVDELKIDRAFIQDIDYENNDFNIVKTVVAIAKSLKYNLIAEGVENITQQDILLDVECDKFQGFLYSRPILASTLEKIVQKNGKLQTPKNKG